MRTYENHTNSVYEHKFTGPIADGRHEVEEIIKALLDDAERNYRLRGGGLRCMVSLLSFERTAQHLRAPVLAQSGEPAYFEMETPVGKLCVTADNDCPNDTFVFVRTPIAFSKIKKVGAFTGDAFMSSVQAGGAYSERGALERVKRTLLERIEIAAKNGDGNATLSLMMAYEKAREMGGG